MSKKNHILLITTENKPGVLNKIASLCRRRRYNVESITAGISNEPNIAHITLVLSGLRQDRIQQIVNQINKIVEIISVEPVEQKEVIDKELILAILKDKAAFEKIKTMATHNIDIKLLNNINNKPIIQIVGEGIEIEHLLSSLNLEKDIIKMARGGLVALKI
jgi:acetolactate synthase-1/3 small subunit